MSDKHNPQAGEVEQTVPEDKFHSELRDLVNRHSKESGSNTPDFVLAEYLDMALKAFDYCVRYRESYYATPAPAGEVEERIGNILMALCARVERVPRGKTYGWSDEQKAIMALFIASQPPVVEGELEAIEAYENALGAVMEELGIDPKTRYRVVTRTIEARQALLAAARQQSADEVRCTRCTKCDTPIALHKLCHDSEADEVRRELTNKLAANGYLQHWRSCEKGQRMSPTCDCGLDERISELTQRGEGGGKA